MSTELSFRNPRLLQPLRWAAWAGLLICGFARAEAAEPFFFIQLSDPQFGMCAANADVQQETANFEFAIATANRILMLEHSIYTVASPEAAASILWRDSSKAIDAATSMKITAQDLEALGVIDTVVKEPVGGAHRDHAAMAQNLKKSLQEALKNLTAMPTAELLATRYERLMSYGRFKEQSPK